MNQKKKIILVSTIVILFLLVAGIVWQVARMSGYYAFYLSTGNIYFGKLAYFSRYTLKDPYYLRISPEEGGPISLEQFQEAFWKPGQTLKFNPENIIWITKLDPDSPVVDYIEAKTKGLLPSDSIPLSPPEVSPPGQTE